MNWLRALRRLLGGSDRHAAFEREQAELRAFTETSTAPGHRRVVAPLGSDGPPDTAGVEADFVVGEDARERSRLVKLMRREILASHTISYGATGVGKSVLWLSLLDQELRRMLARETLRLPPENAILIVEPKHDLAPSFLCLLEHRLRCAPRDVAERVLARLTTFAPMGEYVVPFPLLRPDRDVPPEIHATSLSGHIGRLSGSPFGPKQRPMLDMVLLFFILENLTLVDGTPLLGNWEALRARGRGSSSPMVRSFFEENARFPASSLDGIRARLLRLVFPPNLRAMLSARDGLDFDEILRPGSIAVMDLGGALGDEDLTAFFAGLVFLKLGRAIRRRPNGAPPVVIVIDEFQRVLQGDGDVAEQAATVLETSRSRGAAFHFLTQSPTSVAAVSPRLLSAIHTNAAVEILGAVEDARALQGILPVTSRRRRPPRAPWEPASNSPWMSHEDELRALVEETQGLPLRQFWVRAKRRMSKAVLVRTLDFVIPESQDRALAERIARGRLGRRAAELESERLRGARVRIVEPAVAGRPRRPRGL